MTQSKAGAAKPVEDSQEIDRIIQEIEQMEKSIDQVEAKAPEPAKVVALRAVETPSPVTTEATESITEDTSAAEVASPVVSDPIGFDKVLKAAQDRVSTSAATGDGDLSLSVGGCSSITLEFGRAGTRVTLSCDDDQLTITTDTGAEFRVPFRKAS